MKKLLALLVLLAGIAAAQTTTSITGTLKDLTGAAVTSGKVTFTLMPSADTTISGVARFYPSVVTCLINASGQITNLSGGTCTVTMNTSLVPTGSYYRVDYWPYYVKTASFSFYAVLSSYDWSTVVPTPTTTPAQNFVDIFSNQTIAGNKTFSGTATFSGNLIFSGSFANGFSAPFFSSPNANPAQSGIFRMATTDIGPCWRNTANSGDLCFDLNNSNQLLWPDDFLLGVATSASSMNLGVSTPSATGAGIGLNVFASPGNTSGNGGALNLSAGNGAGSGIGGSVTIAAGTGFQTGVINLNALSITTNSKITNYNAIATVGNGVPAEYASDDLTAQSAALTTQTLYGVPAGGGKYRLVWSAKVTTAATSTSTLGGLTVTYTDPDGTAQTLTAGALSKTGAVETSDSGNSTTTVLLGIPLYLNCKASTVIQIAFAYASSGATAMQYNFSARLEAL